MRSCVADGRTDGQTDGAGYIGPAEGYGGSKKCNLILSDSIDVEADGLDETICLSLDTSFIDDMFGCGKKSQKTTYKSTQTLKK